MTANLSYITLGVNDLDLMHRFYLRGFSFAVKKIYRDSDYPEREFSFFDLDQITLALYRQTSLVADANLAKKHTRATDTALVEKTLSMPAIPAGNVCLSYNVDKQTEVDALMQKLVLFGGTISRAGEVQDWGGYRGYLHDPEGNLWEIVWSPSRNPPT